MLNTSAGPPLPLMNRNRFDHITKKKPIIKSSPETINEIELFFRMLAGSKFFVLIEKKYIPYGIINMNNAPPIK
jgi:hypothetical protein